MAHLFIFGLGYTAKYVKRSVEKLGWTVTSTGREGNLDFSNELAVRAALEKADHVLSSVPPSEGDDPVLAQYGHFLTHDWIGYLSSTGVYGDTGGAWVDESSPIGGGRRSARARADSFWLERGARNFRLPGIYGPSRSALDRVREGRARRIDLPGQVFSRVHVEDIASAVLAGFAAPPGAYNVADDWPCDQNAVIEEACRLVGKDFPPLQSLDEAGLSPMARGFYAENRRIANGKAKRVLGWRPRFADYKVGLRGLLATGA